MDPVTAVGFAASIVTFIDFSWDLIKGTYEVYKSATGTTSENATISTVINDLEEITQCLISDMERKTKHEKALCELAENCYALSQDLAKVLEKLKVTEKNSKLKSLKAKWTSMMKEKEVTSIEKKLDKYRLQILIRVNLMFRWEIPDIFVAAFNNRAS